MKVVTSSIVSDCSGSISGACFSKSRSGLYVRKRQTRSSKSSTLKSSRLSVSAQLSASWKLLSDSERAVWNSVADTNRTGFSEYMFRNQYRLLSSRSLLSVPIPDLPLIDLSTVSASQVVQNYVSILSANLFSSPASELLVYTSDYVSVSIMSPAGLQFRLIPNVTIFSASHVRLYAAENVNSFLPNYAPGKKLFLRGGYVPASCHIRPVTFSLSIIV